MFWNRRLFVYRHPGDILPIFSTMLSGSIGVAVGGLLAWHTFLISTGQGTIDFVDNFRLWKEARKAGRTWKTPHNEGFVKNFKVDNILFIAASEGNFYDRTYLMWTDLYGGCVGCCLQ